MKTMLYSRCWISLVCVALGLVGCEKPPATQPATQKAAPQAQDNPKMPQVKQEGPKLGQPSRGGGVVAGGGNAASMAVRRGADNQTMRNDFRNIGQFYQQYVAENGSGPKRVDDFLNYIQRDAPAIHKRFKDKVYTFNEQAKSSSNSVLVYETDAWTDGTRNILMGDGSVTKMNDAELKQALGRR